MRIRAVWSELPCFCSILLQYLTSQNADISKARSGFAFSQADFFLRCLYILCHILIVFVARGTGCVTTVVFTTIALNNVLMCGQLIRVVAVYDCLFHVACLTLHNATVYVYLPVNIFVMDLALL